jgi:hypothetical protein
VSGFEKSVNPVRFMIEVYPKIGMAKSTAAIIKTKKQAIIKKMVNISWGNGFMPRNAVIAIFQKFTVNIVITKVMKKRQNTAISIAFLKNHSFCFS